jgi:threonine dehydrogenase-like Zn-dependent dehydrogenase
VKAVVLDENGVERLGDIPDPTPRPTDVLVKVDYCGICGSDLHAHSQGFGTGVALGHEFAGEIVELGSSVNGFAVGHRVCVNPNGDWCGVCAFCRAGQHNLCNALRETAIGVTRHGGMAPFAAVPARTVHLLPDGVTTEQGAWVEPLATALRGVRVSGITMGDSAFVSGAGPIGLLVITLLRAMGAGTITAFEPSPLRAAKAMEVGADTVIDPLTTVPEDAFPNPTAAPLHGFECSGVASAIESGLRMLRPRGVLTVTGLARKPPHYQAADLIFKELSIRGSYIYDGEFAKAIDLIDRAVVDVTPLSSGVRDLVAAPEAFADMRRAADLVKVLLRPR